MNWLHEQYPDSIKSGKQPFLNIAKSLYRISEDWALARDRPEEAVAVTKLLPDIESLGFPAKREIAGKLRWLIQRYIKRFSGTARFIPDELPMERIRAVARSVAETPSRTFGILEQRLIDAASAAIHSLESGWHAAAIGQSVFASNRSSKKFGDCEFLNHKENLIAAYESHSGKATKWYLDDRNHPSRNRRKTSSECDEVSRAAQKIPADDAPPAEYVAAVGGFSKTTANLLRKLPLTETSLIVHWCSDDYGLIKTVAKGARRPKSSFAGRLDLFFRCEIEIVPARKGDLHILKELAVHKNRLGIRTTYLRTLAASYFIRLIERVAESETPIPDLSNLLDRALDYLDGAEVDGKAVRFFEKETARLLGLGEEGNDPARVIAATFGELPDLRGELMGRLGSPPA